VIGGSRSPTRSGGMAPIRLQGIARDQLQSEGYIPGAGNTRSLVRDSLDALNAIKDTIPGFDWHNYDRDADGIVDHLWIIHAGLGEEEESTELLDRMTTEKAASSRSSSLNPPHTVSHDPDTPESPWAPTRSSENCGIPCSLMSLPTGSMRPISTHGTGATPQVLDSHGRYQTGHPIGFEPPAPDPLTLDTWGCCTRIPLPIPRRSTRFGSAKPAASREATTSIAAFACSRQPGRPAPRHSDGSHYWWGGKQDVANAA